MTYAETYSLWRRFFTTRPHCQRKNDFENAREKPRIYTARRPTAKTRSIDVLIVARLEVSAACMRNLHDVEPPRFGTSEPTHICRSTGADSRLFTALNARKISAHTRRSRACFDFRENKNAVFGANNVDFVAPASEIARKDFVARLLQKTRGGVLARTPHKRVLRKFAARKQPRENFENSGKRRQIKSPKQSDFFDVSAPKTSPAR